MTSLDTTRGTTEAKFMAQVIDLARTAGWLVYHTHRSTRSPSGFPDLCMAHPSGLLVFAELKVGNNFPTPAQQEWLRILSSVRPRDKVAAYLWTPRDWEYIQAALVRKILPD